MDLLTCADATEWESWLAAHHDSHRVVWLRIAKKGAAVRSVTIKEALDVALCYGWIDGQRKGGDTEHYVQRYSPRGRRSSWSRVNVDRAEELIAAGLMRPPGLAEIERAKADGRWDGAYASQATAEVPPDLVAALAANEPARVAFESLGRTGRYQVILPLLKARTPERRATLVARAVADLASTPR
jgi:uncharacterized protein YdeI (YjbR/CyaY-like superfamily)